METCNESEQSHNWDRASYLDDSVMPPVHRKRDDCAISFNVTIDCNNSAVVGTDSYSYEDRHALLYIVCTLLFYSLGMIIGIVSYIKREKQDIEQDRMFNEFLTSFRGKTEEIHYRQLKVQETIERLADIEKGFGQRNFCDIDSRKPSSGGISLVEKSNFVKFANLSFLRAPVVVVRGMASELGSNGHESDGEFRNPFEDRRLSELVAEILDYDNEDVPNCNTTETENAEVSKDNETLITDTIKESANIEPRRESMQNVDEFHLEDSLDNEDVFAAGITQSQLGDYKYSDMVQENPIHRNIKTTICKSRETVFGVTVPQENIEIYNEKKRSIETEFGVETKADDTKTRWSVTSV